MSLDFYSGTGASELAAMLRQFWSAHGCAVQISLEPVPGRGTVSYALHSNLVGGWPCDLSPEAKAQMAKQIAAELRHARRMAA
jgi:hypothetical protein